MRSLRVRRALGVAAALGMILGAVLRLACASDRDDGVTAMSLGSSAWVPTMYALSLTSRISAMRCRN